MDEPPSYPWQKCASGPSPRAPGQRQGRPVGGDDEVLLAELRRSRGVGRVQVARIAIQSGFGPSPRTVTSSPVLLEQAGVLENDLVAAVQLGLGEDVGDPHGSGRSLAHGRPHRSPARSAPPRAAAPDLAGRLQGSFRRPRDLSAAAGNPSGLGETSTQSGIGGGLLPAASSPPGGAAAGGGAAPRRGAAGRALRAGRRTRVHSAGGGSGAPTPRTTPRPAAPGPALWLYRWTASAPGT